MSSMVSYQNSAQSRVVPPCLEEPSKLRLISVSSLHKRIASNIQVFYIKQFAWNASQIEIKIKQSEG